MSFHSKAKKQQYEIKLFHCTDAGVCPESDNCLLSKGREATEDRKKNKQSCCVRSMTTIVLWGC